MFMPVRMREEIGRTFHRELEAAVRAGTNLPDDLVGGDVHQVGAPRVSHRGQELTLGAAGQQLDRVDVVGIPRSGGRRGRLVRLTERNARIGGGDRAGGGR